MATRKPIHSHRFADRHFGSVDLQVERAKDDFGFATLMLRSESEPGLQKQLRRMANQAADRLTLYRVPPTRWEE